MNKKEESFRNMGFFGKIFVIALIGLLIILALSVAAGGYFFGFVGFFNLSGVEYNTIGSVFLYAVMVFILGLFLDLFARAFFTIASFHISDEYTIIAFRIMLDTAFTWLTLYVVDELMTSVTIPVMTEIAAALFIAILDYVFDHKAEESAT